MEHYKTEDPKTMDQDRDQDGFIKLKHKEKHTEPSHLTENVSSAQSDKSTKRDKKERCKKPQRQTTKKAEHKRASRAKGSIIQYDNDSVILVLEHDKVKRFKTKKRQRSLLKKKKSSASKLYGKLYNRNICHVSAKANGHGSSGVRATSKAI